MGGFPKVTVVMSVYNGEEYLKDAIESMLNQTYTDFEFVVVNDASTDSSRDIILSYSDFRIRLIDNEVNVGLTASLNIGFALAKGEYVARMDSDDVSLPERLETQVKYMEQHPEVGVCGCWVKTIGMKHEVWEYPVTHDEIVSRLIFYNCMAHSAVLIRLSVLEKYKLCYNEDFYYAQDYELWIRIFEFSKLANIPEILLYYRLSNTQIGKKHSSRQQFFADKARKLFLSRLGIKVTDENYAIHLILCNRCSPKTKESIKSIHRWLYKLASHNPSIGKKTVYINTLSEIWFLCCLNATEHKWLAFWGFYRLYLPLQNNFLFLKRNLRLLIKYLS